MSAEEELDSDLHYNKLGLMQAQQRENFRNTLKDPYLCILGDP